MHLLVVVGDCVHQAICTTKLVLSSMLQPWYQKQGDGISSGFVIWDTIVQRGVVCGVGV